MIVSNLWDIYGIIMGDTTNLLWLGGFLKMFFLNKPWDSADLCCLMPCFFWNNLGLSKKLDHHKSHGKNIFIFSWQFWGITRTWASIYCIVCLFHIEIGFTRKVCCTLRTVQGFPFGLGAIKGSISLLGLQGGEEMGWRRPFPLGGIT